jgi:hypothetical protein
LIEETHFLAKTDEEGFSLSLNSKEEEDVLNSMEEDADSFKKMIYTSVSRSPRAPFFTHH